MTKIKKATIAGAVILSGLIAVASTQSNGEYALLNQVRGKPSYRGLASASKPAPLSESYDTIKLTEENSVTFREEVTSVSISKLEKELLKKAKSGKTLYLVLDTPGGDIGAGLDFIDFINGSGIKVKTITQFSASMGAYIAESLGERLVTQHGTYMFHRAKVDGVGGQVPGEFNTRAQMIIDLVNIMERQNANRLGINLEEYTKLVKDEYWVSGAEAVASNVADRVVSISCGEDLQGEYTTQITVFIFKLNVTYSKCPAIKGPLNVEMAESTGNSVKDKQIIQDFIYKQSKIKGLQF